MTRPRSQSVVGIAERTGKSSPRGNAKHPSNDGRSNDGFARQEAQVRRLVSLLDGMPDAQPPPDLVQTTLQRVDAAAALSGMVRS